MTNSEEFLRRNILIPLPHTPHSNWRRRQRKAQRLRTARRWQCSGRSAEAAAVAAARQRNFGGSMAVVRRRRQGEARRRRTARRRQRGGSSADAAAVAAA